MTAWARDQHELRLKLASEFTEEYPEYVHGWVALADALTTLSMYDEARVALRQAERMASDGREGIVWAQLGHLHREMENLPRAEYWYRKAAEARPNTRNYSFLGSVLMSQGRLDEAKRCFDKSILLATEPVDEAHFNLGLIYRAEKNFGRAIENFDAALEIDPDYKRAREALRECRRALPGNTR